jgi:hypothetical protein
MFGTAGSGDWPPGGAVKAGPPLPVGFRVTVSVSSEIPSPGKVGNIVTTRVRVDGVARRTTAAGAAFVDADA